VDVALTIVLHLFRPLLFKNEYQNISSSTNNYINPNQHMTSDRDVMEANLDF